MSAAVGGIDHIGEGFDVLVEGIVVLEGGFHPDFDRSVAPLTPAVDRRMQRFFVFVEVDYQRENAALEEEVFFLPGLFIQEMEEKLPDQIRPLPQEMLHFSKREAVAFFKNLLIGNELGDGGALSVKYRMDE